MYRIMPECGNCGAEVSHDFRRVFRDPDADEVRACPDCDDETVTGAYGGFG